MAGLATRDSRLEIVAGNSAVDHQHGAVGPLRLVGSEEESDVHDVFRLAKAATRIPGQANAFGFRIGEQPLSEERSLDGPGTDRVAADAARRELNSERFGERDDGSL